MFAFSRLYPHANFTLTIQDKGRLMRFRPEKVAMVLTPRARHARRRIDVSPEIIGEMGIGRQRDGRAVFAEHVQEQGAWAHFFHRIPVGKPRIDFRGDIVAHQSLGNPAVIGEQSRFVRSRWPNTFNCPDGPQNQKVASGSPVPLREKCRSYSASRSCLAKMCRVSGLSIPIRRQSEPNR